MASFIDTLPIISCSFREIEMEALFFLDDYQPIVTQNIMPIDVISILEHDIYDYCGVKMDIVDHLPLGVEAQTVFQTKKIQIMELCYHKLFTHSSRDRFTIAHEIGHCILHLPKMNNIQLLAARGESHKIRPFEKPERQANYFASALLMPLPTFCRAYSQFCSAGYSLNEIYLLLAETFKVSTQAVEIRIKNIFKNKGVKKLITELGIKKPAVYYEYTTGFTGSNSNKLA